LSVVAPEGIDPGPGDRQPGWSCLQIAETLDFGMVGVIAGFRAVLAEANVSIFTVSTYNTDHASSVRTPDVESAVRALTARGPPGHGGMIRPGWHASCCSSALPALT
jgi:hypothetical protein